MARFDWSSTVCIGFGFGAGGSTGQSLSKAAYCLEVFSISPYVASNVAHSSAVMYFSRRNLAICAVACAAAFSVLPKAIAA
jgi:hypothetical protein